MLEAERRRALIARYREGHQAVLSALEGITAAELDARPAPGEFTAREVVHHLADSEMTSAVRLRKLIAEDEPVLQGYDENQFARRLYYTQRPIEASLDAVRAARASSASLLELLSEAEWGRTGSHSESGPYSVETWLEIYAAHAHEHADQISGARAASVAGDA